jgi:hypothetical protein
MRSPKRVDSEGVLLHLLQLLALSACWSQPSLRRPSPNRCAARGLQAQVDSNPRTLRWRRPGSRGRARAPALRDPRRAPRSRSLCALDRAGPAQARVRRVRVRAAIRRWCSGQPRPCHDPCSRAIRCAVALCLLCAHLSEVGCWQAGAGLSPHSWIPVMGASFNVRVGPNYEKLKKKAPSLGALTIPFLCCSFHLSLRAGNAYDLLGVDIYSSPMKVPHIARFMKFDKLEGEEVAPLSMFVSPCSCRVSDRSEPSYATSLHCQLRPAWYVRLPRSRFLNAVMGLLLVQRTSPRIPCGATRRTTARATTWCSRLC